MEVPPSSLHVLEERLEKLEKKVFGQPGHHQLPDYDLTDYLANYSNRLGNLLSGRERVEGLMRRVDELERYLDPWFASESTLSEEGKLELVLEAEARLREQAQRLEQLQEGRAVLQSEHLQAVPSLQGRLQELSALQAMQEQNQVQAIHAAKALLQEYHRLTATINASFLRWDQDVTQAEVASLPKPPPAE